jgi:hypothetical protein
MPVPRVSELVYHFKCECESRGWETSQYEDWIRVGNEYHNFLWARTIRPATFKKIAAKHKCAIRQGTSYRVVDVNYTAWLFSETPPEELLQMTEENPELFKKTAIYDMSWIKSEKPTCLKLNQTSSRVFQEFENFLEKNLGVKFKSFKALLSQQAQDSRG